MARLSGAGGFVEARHRRSLATYLLTPKEACDIHEEFLRLRVGVGEDKDKRHLFFQRLSELVAASADNIEEHAKLLTNCIVLLRTQGPPTHAKGVDILCAAIVRSVLYIGKGVGIWPLLLLNMGEEANFPEQRAVQEAVSDYYSDPANMRLRARAGELTREMADTLSRQGRRLSANIVHLANCSINGRSVVPTSDYEHLEKAVQAGETARSALGLPPRKAGSADIPGKRYAGIGGFGEVQKSRDADDYHPTLSASIISRSERYLETLATTAAEVAPLVPPRNWRDLIRSLRKDKSAGSLVVSGGDGDLKRGMLCKALIQRGRMAEMKALFSPDERMRLTRKFPSLYPLTEPTTGTLATRPHYEKYLRRKPAYREVVSAAVQSVQRKEPNTTGGPLVILKSSYKEKQSCYLTAWLHAGCEGLGITVEGSNAGEATLCTQDWSEAEMFTDALRYLGNMGTIGYRGQMDLVVPTHMVTDSAWSQVVTGLEAATEVLGKAVPWMAPYADRGVVTGLSDARTLRLCAPGERKAVVGVVDLSDHFTKDPCFKALDLPVPGGDLLAVQVYHSLITRALLGEIAVGEDYVFPSTGVARLGISPSVLSGLRDPKFGENARLRQFLDRCREEGVKNGSATHTSSERGDMGVVVRQGREAAVQKSCKTLTSFERYQEQREAARAEQEAQLARILS